jgi:hypothetical protein
MTDLFRITDDGFTWWVKNRNNPLVKNTPKFQLLNDILYYKILTVDEFNKIYNAWGNPVLFELMKEDYIRLV